MSAVYISFVCLQVGSDSFQYIMDSIPNTSELGLEYTTLPVGFGVVTDGYYIRVVAAEDNTWVTIATRAERLRQGEYLEEEIENSQKIAKVYCNATVDLIKYYCPLLGTGQYCI